MRRRNFIKGIVGSAVAWPLVARAQQPAIPVIGYLYAGSPESSTSFVAAFRRGLSEIGYIEGQNVAIEYRWANNEVQRLPELATDLVRRQVAVIATPANTPAAIAAKAATTTIPVIFGIGSDPIKNGLVASFNRPGGNVTGVHFMTGEIGAKQLGLLHDLLPRAARFAVLVNAKNPISDPFITDVRATAENMGAEIEVLTASTSRDIDTAFSSLAQKPADALIVGGDSLFNARRVQIATLATRLALPAIYPTRDYTEAGGLISYGPNLGDAIRQVGAYAGRVLKGEKPTDLPVLQSTKLELVINLSTAKAFGLTIPPGVLAIADEAIE
jgi:putative tryptophan/tyrosine transport system substrate-binding protein